MLKQLILRNIAIIEQLDISFDQGLTVITGESGSGKSILVDAISLAFGAKVSPKDVLRAGADRGQVELLFGLSETARGVRQVLDEAGLQLLPNEQEVLISREFTASGSRFRINGIPVSREVLEAIRPWVVDLHGQHELTNLFQKEQQRAYLDAYGGKPLLSAKNEVAQAYDDWRVLFQKLEDLKQNQQAWLQQRDFLAFQVEELDQAQVLVPDEDEQLQHERAVLSHADRLIRVTSEASGILSEGSDTVPSVLDQLATVEKRLNEALSYDEHLSEQLERFTGAKEELRDLAGSLNAYSERVEVNPERLHEIADRLDLLEKLKRKYGPTLVAVIENHTRLSDELSRLSHVDADVETLEAQLLEKEVRLKQASETLQQLRVETAECLQSALLEQLSLLALPAVQFAVDIQPQGYSREGSEVVTFLFSANPGEPLKPLAKVASGGELSRFLLAMKVLTAQADGVSTLVFDEIDSGISGPTAKAVAEKLAMLSQHLQVLTITHQPMIAAMGKQHFHVDKQVQTDTQGHETVQVQVSALHEHAEQRLNTLSRLVSGVDTNDEAVEKFIQRLQEQAEAFHQQAEKQLRPLVKNPQNS